LLASQCKVYLNLYTSLTTIFVSAVKFKLSALKSRNVDFCEKVSMATILKTISANQDKRYVRPFDMRRDLERVVNLVELCFEQTLDESGRRYLRRMRAMANNPTLMRFSALTSDWAAVPLSGYVWEQDGRLVGNVSLVPYTVKRQRHYLIANVAVHPEYRRRGIARSLTKQSLARARMRGVKSVWLHVRQENRAAIDLYTEQGFIERTRRTTWINDPGAVFDFTNQPISLKIKLARARHWGFQQNWLKRSYPPEYSWHLPLRPGQLRPGILGHLLRAISGTDVRSYAAIQDEKLHALLSVHTKPDRDLDLWLAAPPDGDPASVGALLTFVHERSLPRQTLNLEYPADRFTQAIQTAGYRQQQTLIWMTRSF
jgi:ribosomal protein S18 acetylase RimI-like enzyme